MTSKKVLNLVMLSLLVMSLGSSLQGEKGTGVSVTVVNGSQYGRGTCTDGVDCYCDMVADPNNALYDSNIIFCEDFERLDINNGPPVTGSRKGWTDLYGVGANPCIYNPAPGTGTGYTIMAAGVDESCILVVDANTCEMSNKTDCIFDGNQSLAHRHVPGRNQGITGTAYLPSQVQRFGVTYAVKYSSNFQIPTVANKHNEFGVGFAPILGASTSNTGRNHPFGGSVFTSSGSSIVQVFKGVYSRDPNIPSPSGGRIRFSPSTVDYEWGS